MIVKRPRGRTGLLWPLVAAALALTVTLPLSLAGGSPSPPPNFATGPPLSAATHVPVYAYFYQWYTASSWNRAKEDYPLAGRYSSDDTSVLRTQVRQARGAGIDGFLTSWKDTVPLDRRLVKLIKVAQQWDFDLGVVYEALDFQRRPLPVASVQKDMTTLVTTYGAGLTSHYFGRPLIIWTGTDQYSRADVQQVRNALNGRAVLLAAAKSVSGYDQIADLVDGEAYYWSSADPRSPTTASKLNQMSAAVHAHHGLWFAPATGGFDGTTLGHTRVISRNGGATLRQSLGEAFGSNPSAVAVISWNEWSENTYIEPSERYGSQELDTLTNYLLQARAGKAGTSVAAGTHHTSGWTGMRAVIALAAGTLALSVVLLVLSLWRRWAWKRALRGQHRVWPPERVLR